MESIDPSGSRLLIGITIGAAVRVLIRRLFEVPLVIRDYLSVAGVFVLSIERPWWFIRQ